MTSFDKDQYDIFLEHREMTNTGNTDSFPADLNGLKDPICPFLPQISTESAKEYLDSDNIFIDSSYHCNPVNSLHQLSCTSKETSSILLDATNARLNPSFTPSNEDGLQDLETSQNDAMNTASVRATPWTESSWGTADDHMNETSHLYDSDLNEDEENTKYRNRNGKGPQSKNLQAERRRRKKLNDRLYALRALVPNISKLDKAAILGDAIDYVNELLKQVKDLQIELEDHSNDDDDAEEMARTQTRRIVIPTNDVHQTRFQRGNKRTSLVSFPSGDTEAHHPSKQNSETSERMQQMEPQVEVYQLDGNEFFIKVFCEHKSKGFVRLLEAFNYLGLEVTNVNTTRHTCLVSTNFKVERRHNDSVQADHVRQSLLELTRNPVKVWPT